MNRLGWVALRAGCAAIVVVAVAGASAGCKKSAGAAPTDGASDGGSDAVGEAPAVQCPPVDGGGPSSDAGTTLPGTDEFGPNAPVGKAASSLGRVNVYEITAPTQLERVDIYLRADLPHTRLTIAVQEAPSRTAAFTKLADLQIDMDVCEGWISSGPIAIPLKVGRFYAIGFDPNQVVTPFVSTDGESLPIDGVFGRLIGSKTANSVSVPSIGWDKFLDKEYNRQRILTSPRAPDPVPDASADGAPSDASSDASSDAGTADAPRG
ncbi:MAG: hypothetical protein H7X95_09515 [Deltaproteobacteria bacterium]|nr:hypothetical protein [Deltaproteobacteria bacterium]